MLKMEEVRWGSSNVMHESHVKYLEGKILTQIEMLGLSERQEEAFKSLFRSTLWGWWEKNSLFLSEELHNKAWAEALENESDTPRKSSDR